MFVYGCPELIIWSRWDTLFFAAFIDGPKTQEIDQCGDLVMGPGGKRDASLVPCLLGTGLIKLSREQKDALNKAKKYATEQSVKMVLMKQTIAHQQQQAKSLQRHQALVLMCRVYVGSISFELKEDTIRQAFSPFGPINSISMSWDPITQRHKGFAFVEYEIPEAAQLAFDQMNGVMIGGRNVKVGRPSQMPQAQGEVDEIIEESKNYNRLYVASIHVDLSEEDVKSVFEAFGTIKSCRLASSGIGKHKGYGFIEYNTSQALEEAIASMNLFDLGGQFLRVGKACTPPNALNVLSSLAPIGTTMPTAAAVAAAAATAKIQAMDAVACNAMVLTGGTLNHNLPMGGGIGLGGGMNVMMGGINGMGDNMGIHMGINNMAVLEPTRSIAMPPPGIAMSNGLTETIMNKAEQQKKQADLAKKLMENEEPQTLQQQEDLSIKGQSARHLVMRKLLRNSQSRVIVLRNMVGPEDVDETLQDEITEECSKYGAVDRVVIYQESQSEDDNALVIIKIFVEFHTPEEADVGFSSLNGRYFGGRLVKAESYDQMMYEHNDLSG